MKKFKKSKVLENYPDLDRQTFKKIFRIVQIAIFCFFLGSIQVRAVNSYAKITRLSLDINNERLENVLNRIEDESEFFFLLNKDLVDVEQKVSINIDNETINVILDALFEGTKITYTIDNRQIVLSNIDMISEMTAQQKTISGKVTDEQGQPLPGVTIVIKGSTLGTISDVEGNYSLSSVPADATLEFSFVGMKTQEISVVGITTINVTMAEEAGGINEVVTIGDGTNKRGNLTGAVSVINSDQITNRPAIKTTDLLQGVSPGLQITRSNTGNLRGSENKITIRGVTSRSAPGVLVVIDGIAQASTNASSLDNINPNDIESISILKDSEAAIYGARAAGGVILVTTKSGSAEKPTINFSSILTLQKPSLSRELPNLLDVFQMQYEGYINDGQETNIFTKFHEFVTDNDITFDDIKNNDRKYLMREPYGYPYPYYLGHHDWYDIMYDQALEQNYNLSISGKSKKFSYYEAVNYVHQDGMLAYGKNYRERLLITLKNDYEVTDYLKVLSIVRIGNVKVVEPYNYSHGKGVQNNLWRVGTFNEPYTAGGNYENVGGFFNPIGMSEAAGNTTDGTFILHGKLGAEITPFNNFVIIGEAAIDYDITETDWADIGVNMYDVLDERVTISNNGQNRAGGSYNRNRHMVGNIYANYSFEKWRNHRLKLMAGYSHEENDFRYLSAYRRYGQISSEVPTMIMGDPNEQYNYEIKNDYALNSFFSRVNYIIKDRYLLEGIFRYDGSSRFAPGHKWSPFYGVSGGWIISEENFMDNVKNVFSFLKIRASWGQMGNQSGIGLYDYIPKIYIGGSYPYGSWTGPSKNQSATFGSMPSTTRTWETIESSNLGIDFRLFNSKLSGSFDAFIKENRGMFVNREFPAVLGATAPNINGAHFRTKGWEAVLGWNDKIKKDLNYNIGFHISNTNNEVIDLEDNLIPYSGRNSFVQGYPTDSYFGLRFDGFIKDDADLTAYNSKFSSGIPNNLKPGDAKYEDLNGDGILTLLPYVEDENGNPAENSGDLIQFGEGSQHYMYSINLGLNWKNFDVSAFFNGVGRWNIINNISPNERWHYWNETYMINNYWTPDRPDALWARLSQNSQIRRYDYQYSDASYKMFNNKYIRLKNIQVGYTLPKHISQKVNIERLRIYFDGTDIWEHTNLPGKQDFETPFSRTRTPFPRRYSFGIDLTF